MLVYGARQVGKSTTIYEFGKEYYSNVVILNFENNLRLQHVFKIDMNPKRIISELEGYLAHSINAGSTLVFFDEIQECPEALTSLKYFAEQAPHYHIIAAGSFLGVAVNRESSSFPVGKVDILTMYPMTFEEFLMAANPQVLESIYKSYQTMTPLSQILHEAALTLYRIFLFTGGMPRVVSSYVEKNDLSFMRIRQNEIITLYASDISKYTQSKSEQVKINAIYNSIPSQLAKENSKFMYSLIGSHARAASYEIGLSWLENTAIVIKCIKVREGKIPLSYYSDFQSYKIYMSDIGLLNAKADVPQNLIINEFSVASEAKGAITENYVACELHANGHKLYYWESGGKAEIDFVIQKDWSAIPVEVKAATNTQSKSLKQFINKYNPEYSIRISANHFGFENNIKSIPIYAVFCIK